MEGSEEAPPSPSPSARGSPAVLQSQCSGGGSRSSDPGRDPVRGVLFRSCSESWSPRARGRGWGGLSSVVLGCFCSGSGDTQGALLLAQGGSCQSHSSPHTPLPQPVLEPVGGPRTPRAAWAPEGLLRCAVLTAGCVLVRQVHIEFTEGEDRITLEGPTEDVSVAQEQIEAMVKDLVRGPQPHPERRPSRHSHQGLGGPGRARSSGRPRERARAQKEDALGALQLREQGGGSRWPPDLGHGGLPICGETWARVLDSVPTALLCVPLQINRMDYVEINIDHRFHRHLIGKSGANSEWGPRAEPWTGPPRLALKGPGAVSSR